MAICCRRCFFLLKMFTVVDLKKKQRTKFCNVFTACILFLHCIYICIHMIIYVQYSLKVCNLLCMYLANLTSLAGRLIQKWREILANITNATSTKGSMHGKTFTHHTGIFPAFFLFSWPVFFHHARIFSDHFTIIRAGPYRLYFEKKLLQQGIRTSVPLVCKAIFPKKVFLTV